MMPHNQLYEFFTPYLCKSKLMAISLIDSCQNTITLNIMLTRQEVVHFETVKGYYLLFKVVVRKLLSENFANCETPFSAF